MNNLICAGIILYNPDIQRLDKSLNSIMEQFDKVYIFDNSTIDHSDLLKKYNFSKLEYISKFNNLGIAYALNTIMLNAKNDGYKWVVTFDQDSVIPINLIEAYRKYTNIPNIGIICPQVIDKRRQYMKIENKNDIDYVDFCITSASCTNIEIWEKVGRFDDFLFIDLVDNDFCKRVIVSGFKIIRLNEFVLDQEFGNIKLKSTNKVNFYLKLSKILQNENIAKLSYYKKVDPKRVYYTNRNIIYLNKKFKDYNGIGYDNYNVKTYFGFLIAFSLASLCRGEHKMKILDAIFKGILDGLKKQVNKFEV